MTGEDYTAVRGSHPYISQSYEVTKSGSTLVLENTIGSRSVGLTRA